jgi:hypothetical protein
MRSWVACSIALWVSGAPCWAQDPPDSRKPATPRASEELNRAWSSAAKMMFETALTPRGVKVTCVCKSGRPRTASRECPGAAANSCECPLDQKPVVVCGS